MNHPGIESAKSVLLVEDDDVLSSMLVSYLESSGYNICHCSSIKSMVELLSYQYFDVILLDLSLPDGDGLAFLLNGYRVFCPIICITANQSIDVRIEALDNIAVDLLVKPFDERELLSRLRKVLHSERVYAINVVRFGGFTFNLASGKLETANGEEIALTTAEARFLWCLAKNHNHPVTRKSLMRSALNRPTSSDERIVDVNIGRLRKKLGPKGRTLIRSVRHVGYLLYAEGMPALTPRPGLPYAEGKAAYETSIDLADGTGTIHG